LSLLVFCFFYCEARFRFYENGSSSRTVFLVLLHCAMAFSTNCLPTLRGRFVGRAFSTATLSGCPRACFSTFVTTSVVPPPRLCFGPHALRPSLPLCGLANSPRSPPFDLHCRSIGCEQVVPTSSVTRFPCYVFVPLGKRSHYLGFPRRPPFWSLFSVLCSQS